jgi:hypothetical protein
LSQMAQKGQRRPSWTVATVAFSLVMTASASLTIGLAAAQGETGGEDNLPRYWQIHAALLTTGTACIVASYVALWLKILGKLEGLRLPAITTRISRLWYRFHIYLGVLGVGLSVAGVILGYLMVQWAYGGPHLRIIHSYIGIATGAIISIPLITGFVSRVMKRGRTTIRWWHVVLGLVGIGMMVLGTYSGWALE